MKKHLILTSYVTLTLAGLLFASQPIKVAADSLDSQDLASIAVVKAEYRKREAAREAAEAEADARAAEEAANPYLSRSAAALEAAAVNGQSGNFYAWGQCTWGVKEMAPWAGNNWGNAGQWAVSAQVAGFTVGTVPVPGAIAVWMDGGYGHVAYVTEVASETSIQVIESNVNGDATLTNHRGWFDPTIAQGQVVYIYPPATA